MKKLVLLVGLAVSYYSSVIAQILTVSPAFPTVNDVVTITYNATEGNGALAGVTPPVFAHTGVITSTSSSLTNWQFVQGTWGTADPSVQMTPLGNNLYQITIDIDAFYGFPGGTTVNYLAFVFRNTAGSTVGRSTDGSDIYYPVYPTNAGFLARFFAPESAQTLDLNEQLNLVGKSNQPASLSIKDNGVTIASAVNATQLTHVLSATASGDHILEFIADNGVETIIDSAFYVVNPTVTYQNPPAGIKDGLNRINDTTVIVQLVAPEKEHVYVLGDFNNWQAQTAYHMNCSLDSTKWWIPITNLDTNVRYGYQYLIDNEIKVADPLSELIADPNNDNAIDTLTYPNRYTYPTGQTTGFITLFETKPSVFNWQHDSFIRPEKKDLMVYELLVRDFIAKHNYATLIDTLDYLDSLGINAIELMPVNEFENNESWGYNPSFHMALDKYYGTPQKFKAFIDACHERGIAVIMDVVLNHAFGQNPMVNMYWDAASNNVAANNPWFNQTCPHQPYCWGYDMDHEAQLTKNYIDRVNHYWLDEFHIDGYRFDFAKGFVNSSALYSATRIAILKRMADTIWSVHPNTYVILEHFADNNEEIILSDYGMMLWGNITGAYHDNMRGYSGNLTSGIYSERNWNNPHLITYSESHDEERGMFTCLDNGNSSNPVHDVKNEFIALSRAEAAGVLLITTPGPKMIWQFGELGYDYSIDFGCRVCNKPIRWDYYTETYRKKVYEVYKATLNLRQNYPVFRSLNFTHALSGTAKRLVLQDSLMDAVVLVNFAVQQTPLIAGFPQTGWWYEYFTGDSINVSNVNQQLSFQPAEYRIYTSSRIAKPEITQTASIEEIENELGLGAFPVPFTDEVSIRLSALNNQDVQVTIRDATGSVVFSNNYFSQTGDFEKQISSSEWASGMYVVEITVANQFLQTKIIKH